MEPGLCKDATAEKQPQFTRWHPRCDGLTAASIARPLAVKMPEELKSVLDLTVKLRTSLRPDRRPFLPMSCALRQMRSQHVQLLLHIEVRWLSRGKALSRLFRIAQRSPSALTGQKLIRCLWKHSVAQSADILRSQWLLDFWIQRHSEYPALSPSHCQTWDWSWRRLTQTSQNCLKRQAHPSH